MLTLSPSLFSILLLISFLLSGCATKPIDPSKNHNEVTSLQQRTAQLLKKSAWQLNGKIAFIQQTQDKSKRESASLIWQVNETQQTQELNLTSYLGINVLQLKSNKKQHLIKVEGKEYRGENLSNLIYSLTGLTLPTKALTFWLKGLPYKTDDKLQFNESTQLPITISSYYNNELWRINYANYEYFNNIKMATQFTIEKDDLLIKIAVKNWLLND
jgi:outer membrane lipoprotein LolB